MVIAKTLQGVHQYLTGYAHSQPDHVFLLAEKGVTYQQAARWVHHIATEYLAGLNGERVTIWMAKGNDYALSILATLHANCVYVPLDGSQPAFRAIKIIEDASSRIAILDAAHYAELKLIGIPNSVEKIILLLKIGQTPATYDDPRVVAISFDELCSYDLPPPTSQAIPEEQTAAILYTSGSTGKPKGVQFNHRNLANFVRWSCHELSFTQEDVFLNIASFNFDISTFDLFASLQTGASLYMTNESEQQAVGKLAEILRTHEVTILYTVPSLLALMTRASAWDLAQPLRLRRLLFAGEVMPMPQLNALMKHMPANCELYNLYGPTETNVCLYHKVTQQDTTRITPVPIGKPIANVEVWLQDENGNVVPPNSNALGEILVTGNCVTPGYWRLNDPKNFSNHNRYCHATGDLACYENGALVYHGRLDRMLKINGYRVELGEIEAVLATYPGIQEIAVIVEKKDMVRLVAYVCAPESNTNISIDQIKNFCSTRLPKYMIPHKVVHLQSLPKNANGKIDYLTLSNPEKLI